MLMLMWEKLGISKCGERCILFKDYMAAWHGIIREYEGEGVSKWRL
jgi:hypothetical protein